MKILKDYMSSIDRMATMRKNNIDYIAGMLKVQKKVLLALQYEYTRQEESEVKIPLRSAIKHCKHNIRTLNAKM